MSFGKLRNYIDSCLNALASDQPDVKFPILGKDDFLKLLDLLHAKADAPFSLRGSEQATDVEPLVETPTFPAFAPSEKLTGLLQELNQLQSQLIETQADLTPQNRASRSSNIKSAT
jgi:hypothetical protein